MSNCKHNFNDYEFDSVTGGSWEKCSKCGFVLDNPDDGAEKVENE